MTKRIQHVISGLGAGGAERTLESLVLGLKERGYDQRVTSLSDIGPIGAALRKAGISVEAMGFPRRRLPVAGIRALGQDIRGYRPDLVQTWMYHANILGLIAAGGDRSTPIVWNIRGSARRWHEFGLSTWLMVRAGATLSNRPSAIVANSEAGLRDHVRMGYKARRWVVIPNGIDTDRFRPNAAERRRIRAELGAGNNDILVGVVGRYHSVKGSSEALQAFASIHAWCPETILGLAGEGMVVGNSRLRATVRDLALENAVRLIGPRTDVPVLMNGLDLLVSPSHSEGFPNVVAEAMATGIPCVVTNVGDSSLIVADTGAVVPPREPRALEAALRQLIEIGRAGRVGLGRRARERIRSTFSKGFMLEAYSSLYEGILGSRAHAGIPRLPLPNGVEGGGKA